MAGDEMVNPEDIVPVSDLQDRLRAVLEQTRRTKRPVVVTQRGRPAGVLLDIGEYTRLVELAEQAELEADIARGEQAIAQGDLHDWEEIKRERLGWLLEK
ncbi:MAG: type II toxin-antitoxin system Phd/YefM family antitoxin [Chloroflexota bacterium]